MLGLAFVWSLVKWLFIPVLGLLILNSSYDNATGAKEVHKAEMAAFEAQKAKVSFSLLQIFVDESGLMSSPKMQITVVNNSDGLVSKMRFRCNVTMPGKETHVHDVQVDPAIVVRPGVVKTVTLEKKDIVTYYQKGYFQAPCHAIFDLWYEPGQG